MTDPGDPGDPGDRCPICRYSLEGITTERCPECGELIVDPPRDRRRAIKMPLLLVLIVSVVSIAQILIALGLAMVFDPVATWTVFHVASLVVIAAVFAACLVFTLRVWRW